MLKFGIVGVAGATYGYLLFWLFADIFQEKFQLLGLSIVAVTTWLPVSFIAYSRWVFQTLPSKKKFVGHLLQQSTGLVSHPVFFFIFLSVIPSVEGGDAYLLAMIAATALSFFISRNFVYRSSK